MDAGFEMESSNYISTKRLPELRPDWSRNLPSPTNFSCFCYIPNGVTGENNPPESTEEMPEDSQQLETAVLVIGILVGFLGFVVGIIVIVKSKMELPGV